MVKVTVNTSGLDSLLSDLRTGVAEGAKKVGAAATEMVRQNLDAEGNRTGETFTFYSRHGAETGSGWQPTSLIALAKRKIPPTDGADYKILHDTGNLSHLITSKVTSASANRIELEVFSGAKYGDLLHTGGPGTIDGNSVEIPTRRFMLLLDPDDPDDLTGVMESVVLEALLG